MFSLVIRLQKTSSRRLQDVLIKANIFALTMCLQDVFKTFPIHLQDIFKKSFQDVLKTSSKRLQGIFKTSSNRLQDVLQKCLQDIFKMPSRRFEDAFKTYSRYFEDVWQRCSQDVFKTYHQVKLFA